MVLYIGFDKVIGLSNLPALPLGDSYHVCLYNPATGLEYQASETSTNIPEGLGGDVFYIWDKDLTATMTEGSYDLKVYDLQHRILFKQSRMFDAERPHVEACNE